MTHRFTALAALALCLLLFACPPGRTGGGDDDDDSASCVAVNGTLRACVYWSEDGDAAGGSSVMVRSDPEEEPIQAIAGEDGCVEISLEPGTWQASGSSAAGDCVTPYEEQEIEACGLLEVDFYLMNWCMDGR